MHVSRYNLDEECVSSYIIMLMCQNICGYTYITSSIIGFWNFLLNKVFKIIYYILNNIIMN